MWLGAGANGAMIIYTSAPKEILRMMMVVFPTLWYTAREDKAES